MTEESKPKDWSKIRDAGYAAKLSYVHSHPEKYEDNKAIEPDLLQKFPGYTFQEVRNKNAFALLAVPPTNDKPAFVAFAGSDDPKDWQLNFTPIPSLDHGNHLGFNIMYESLNPPENPVITRFIEHMEKQGVEVYACGHSMGGALATLCGQEHGDKHKMNVVALNVPSTGRRSAKYINSLDNLNITNFVKQGDFVSMGGTGTLAGDTYVVSDIPIGKSFMVTHEQMDHKIIPAAGRFMKNVAGFIIPQANPIEAHGSDAMLSYMEKLAENNQAFGEKNRSFGAMAHLSDQEETPDVPKTPRTALLQNLIRR